MQADPGPRTAVLIVRTWTEGDGLLRARLLAVDGTLESLEPDGPGDLGAVIGRDRILERVAVWLASGADEPPR